MRHYHRFPHGVVAGLIAWVMVESLSGCGYTFVGESSLLPKDAKTVFVEPFINRSRDIGVESELTSALRGEFYRRGPLRLVEQADLADVIITGVVRALSSSVVSVNKYDEVLQYESTLDLDVTLRRREPNEILWRGQDLKLNDLFAGSRAAVVTTSSDFRNKTLNSSDVRQLTDVQLTEIQRRSLRTDLMERFAAELHHRIMEMF